MASDRAYGAGELSLGLRDDHRLTEGCRFHRCVVIGYLPGDWLAEHFLRLIGINARLGCCAVQDQLDLVGGKAKSLKHPNTGMGASQGWHLGGCHKENRPRHVENGSRDFADARWRIDDHEIVEPC